MEGHLLLHQNVHDIAVRFDTPRIERIERGHHVHVQRARTTAVAAKLDTAASAP